MAADPNPALRTQLKADYDALAPQIRGLPDIAGAAVSPTLIAALDAELAIRERRRDLIQAALDQLDRVVTALVALEADGWPEPVEQMTLDPVLFAELQGEQRDTAAAAAVFRQQAAITIGPPTTTSQPPPDGASGP